MNGAHIQHFLRPGHLRIDCETYVRLRPTYQGLILNAPSLINRSEASDFLRALETETPFLIDPRTFALATTRGELQNPDNRKLKQSWVHLLHAYGVNESSLPLDPETVKVYGQQLVERTIQFQLTCVMPQSQMNLFGTVYAHEPIALVAPYFAVTAKADPWLPVNLELARATKRVADNRRAYAVLQLHRPLLSLHYQLDAIVGQFAALPVDGFLLWIDGFHEREATVEEVQSLRAILGALRQPGSRPIINMYGGYLSALLRHWGLSGFCHRHDGGESRKFTPVGGGPIDVRYYLPALHRHYTVDIMESYLKRREIEAVPQFLSAICDCVICRGITRDGLNGFTQNYAAREIKNGRLQATHWAKSLAASHFMLSRHRELKTVQDTQPEILLEQLVANARDYRDPLLVDKAMVDTNHLRVWSQGLTT